MSDLREAESRIGTLLRFWFTFEKPVGPRAYFTHGFALAVLKYAVDAALIGVFLGILWTPLDYLTTGASLASSKLAGGPTILLVILALWTLPFFWIALPGGRTRLEGSTWYEVRLQPHVYWAVLSDRLVGRIHGRVLRHIRDVSVRDVQREHVMATPTTP